ncbi:hypothetical protein [Nitratireductor sp. CH_MIT9313-5]|jgi:hypothetical protein|uniref:hypothetical protein n=1 Tax=Nitratireductor sp. CH_MIT9313-5 TaxID=3107764 RepID=UPI003009C25B
MMAGLKALTIAILLAGSTGASLAACPQELAVYTEAYDGRSALEFVADTRKPDIHQHFRLLLRGAKPYSGTVELQESGTRSLGRIDGMWSGAIYAVQSDGSVTPLKKRGSKAAQSIILSDLSYTLNRHKFADGTPVLPVFDLYHLTGCQE